MRILIVLTSHDRLGDTGRMTGFWPEELAAPYFVFKEAGYAITGQNPASSTPAARRLIEGLEAAAVIATSADQVR